MECLAPQSLRPVLLKMKPATSQKMTLRRQPEEITTVGKATMVVTPELIKLVVASLHLKNLLMRKQIGRQMTKEPAKQMIKQVKKKKELWPLTKLSIQLQLRLMIKQLFGVNCVR